MLDKIDTRERKSLHEELKRELRVIARGKKVLNDCSSYALARDLTQLIRRFKPPVSPEQMAKDSMPFWFQTIRNYDGLEVAPVAEYEDKDGCKFCECVDLPEEARFWSVYGHLPEGGVECFEDFPTRQEAMNFANRLLNMFPNLQKHGLVYA